MVDQEFALNDGHGQVQFEQQQGPEADHQPTGPGRREERDEHDSARVGAGLEDQRQHSAQKGVLWNQQPREEQQGQRYPDEGGGAPL